LVGRLFGWVGVSEWVGGCVCVGGWVCLSGSGRWVFVKVPLFQDTPDDFLCELCMHVVRFVFSPGEVVIHSDEPVHEIYIVHRGICQVFVRLRRTQTDLSA